MGLFSWIELSDLLASPDLPCISIYLPACIHKQSETPQQQFQQAVDFVLQRLAQDCDRSHNSEFFTWIAADFQKTMQALKPQMVNALATESAVIFYQHQFLRCYYLPGHFAAAASVDRSFYLQPLLPLLAQGELFYMLAFGQSQVQLLQGSRQAIRQVSLAELPETLVEAMALNRFEPSLPLERVRHLRAMQSALVEDDFLEREAQLKQQMYQSCKHLKAQLDRLLKPQNTLLLLAGMPQILSTYRTLNPTSTMLNTEIAGNLDTMKLEELHQQAWSRVQELVNIERDQALSEYEQAVQKGCASNHLGDIITKAINGKVKTLFISSTYRKWGRFNPYTWEVDVHWRPEPGDIDLTQFAIEQTLLRGGSVYQMQSEKVSPRTASERSKPNSSTFETIGAIFQ